MSWDFPFLPVSAFDKKSYTVNQLFYFLMVCCVQQLDCSVSQNALENK